MGRLFILSACVASFAKFAAPSEPSTVGFPPLDADTIHGANAAKQLLGRAHVT